MTRAVISLWMVGLASALVKPSKDLAAANCGNCNVKDKDGYLRCNTGGRGDRIPYFKDQDFSGMNEAQTKELTFHGKSNAQVLRVAEMRSYVKCHASDCAVCAEDCNALAGDAKTACEARRNNEDCGSYQATYSNDWETMFCADYVDRYLDGSWTPESGKTGTVQSFDKYGSVHQGSGAACVRSPMKKDILKADAEAKAMYDFMGTKNGFASSYSLNKGKAMSNMGKKWGTSFEGDVPANWCGSYVKYLLCGIAFPQVAKTEAEIEASRQEQRQNTKVGEYVDFGKGSIRPIEFDSCENLHAACVRHQPDNGEEKGDYVHPSMNHTRGTFFQDNDPEERESEMDQSLLCTMWSRGHGLSEAGTSLVDKSDDKVIAFEAAGAVQASLAGLALMVLALAL